ncbi:hypothetical protein [Streptomyces sp. NPDC047706]|uniref:hypothetical protein n=1 Tax=Streptomyces sp. NPDC047706 TaxID=3365486 RepID=UPI003719395A
MQHKALRNWIRHAEDDASDRGDMLGIAELEVLSALRNEIVQLKKRERGPAHGLGICRSQAPFGGQHQRRRGYTQANLGVAGILALLCKRVLLAV